MSYQKFGSLLHSIRSASVSRPDRTARTLASIGVVLAVASLALSMTIAVITELRTRAAEQHQFLSETYSTYLETDRLLLEHPEVAHEFVSPDEYQDELQRVRSAFATATPEEKARFRLREEAIAFYVFSAFARLVNAQGIPQPMRSAATRQFVEGEMAYFGHDLLRNPRLVYFWRDEEGYKYYDDATNRAYNAQVRDNLKSLPSDRDGPFR